MFRGIVGSIKSLFASKPPPDPYATGKAYVAEISKTTELTSSLSALIFSYSRSYSINSLYRASPSKSEQIEATKLFLSRLRTVFQRDPFFPSLRPWNNRQRYNEILEWEQNVNATLQKLDKGILPKEEVVCQYVRQICLPPMETPEDKQNYKMLYSNIICFSLLELENCLDRNGLQKEKDSHVKYVNSPHAKKWNQIGLIIRKGGVECTRVFWNAHFSGYFPCPLYTLFNYSAMHLVYVSDARISDDPPFNLQAFIDEKIKSAKREHLRLCFGCSSEFTLLD